MWTRPMIPYTGIRKGVSFTGITATIAICRCISLAGIGCSARVCGRRMRNLPPGASRELSRIVAQVRAAWPEVRIVLRGDSGFCREAIMSWCETHRVEYVLGLAKNSRLTEIIAGE